MAGKKQLQQVWMVRQVWEEMPGTPSPVLAGEGRRRRCDLASPMMMGCCSEWYVPMALEVEPQCRG